MMNKKGSMVLRNIIFIIIIFSGVIALSSVFVNEMGDTYSNTNMTSSYNQDVLGNEQLNETSTRWHEIGENMNDNILLGTIQATWELLKETLTAPITLGDILEEVLIDFNVDKPLSNIFGYILAGVLYVIIIFVIGSAFLQGGKL